jgi:adenosylcobinamide kinase/adenosylcobinamide-phosphate guanylyltransferase
MVDPDDAEMTDRVARHRADRGPAWGQTIEISERVSLAAHILSDCGQQTILIDCVTLWLSQLGIQCDWNEERCLAQVDALAAILADPPCERLAVVTNEVGDGVVPEHAMGRAFRDLQGRANQRLAAAAQHVGLVVCGLPLWLKGGVECP